MTSEVATVGGGCFWCLEAPFNQLNGVVSAISGYAGGSMVNPNYESVCGGQTGHAEVVQVTFDPALLSYEQLLRLFFELHDPTTLNRQGHDRGTQYRSAIFTHSATQEQVATGLIADLSQRGLWAAPIVTEVKPLECFYPAEEYHQNFFERNPYQGYCRAIIAPKMEKLRRSYPQWLKQS